MKVVKKKDATMLTLGFLAKLAKECSLDSSISDEVFLNALIEPYVEAGKVKARGSKTYKLDKSRVSRILSGKCDVPVALRKALPRYGIEKATAEGFIPFLEECIDVNCLDRLVEEVLESLSDNDVVHERALGRKENPAALMSFALMEALKNDNQCSSEQLQWRSGKGSLSIEVGDLFAHCFGKPRKTKQIIVIPVDTTFETRVTWNLEETSTPFVSPKSLHGKWVLRMDSAGVSKEELADRIDSSLRRRGILPLGKGNDRPEYPIGSIAVIENTRSVFYLLAISRFDEKNNAFATRKDIVFSLNQLFGVYNREGQGLDLLIPLMGTGSSRANLTHQESLDLIMEEAKRNIGSIHGKVNIVVYREDAGALKL